MGNILSKEAREDLLDWADSFRPNKLISVKKPVAKSIKIEAEHPLRCYWGLAQTARNRNVEQAIRDRAHQKLFSVRTRLEKWIMDSVLEAIKTDEIKTADLLDGRVFGSSLKQGVSFRLPLASCQPSEKCAGGCYAHDGLDASIASVIRGALNGAFAQAFERSEPVERKVQLAEFWPFLKRAVVEAFRDCDRSVFPREPRVRMAHVGELSAFQTFANAIGSALHELSQGKVKCVVYTRHGNAKLLDPDLFVINFSLDASSLKRRSWVPDKARIVYSAWDGEVHQDASVNFLEHHYLQHESQKGEGTVCPATMPNITERTCDALSCDFCFKKPNRD